jgi:SAM-dependent methyltransferase
MFHRPGVITIGAMEDRDDLRAHLEIERPLADRLRNAATQDERRALYGPVYSDYRAQIAGHPSIERRDAQRSSVPMQAALVRPLLRASSTFVELGAGEGALAAELAPEVARAIALDVTDAIAVSGPPGYEFRVIDGIDLGLVPGSVDLVFSNDVVEHLHRDDAVDQMRAVGAALRPGGRYLCVTPNRLSGPHDVSGAFGDTPQGFHLCEYTVTELRRALRQAGFRRVQIFLSRGGRHLTPLLPAGLIAPLEAVLGALPRAVRRRPAAALAAVKVIATW